jgi:uncharacterized membrane protein (UPF0127 family)
MANFLLPLIKDTAGEYQLRNVRNGRLVAETVIPAFEPAARRKGLLGRDSFAEGSAMVIAPSNAIHTFWMRFPIDVLFVRRNGTVVKVSRNVPPWRAVVGLRGYGVIELPSGALAPGAVAVGDVLALKPADVSEAQTPAFVSEFEEPLMARVS